jgi:hypothetical protein
LLATDAHHWEIATATFSKRIGSAFKLQASRLFAIAAEEFATKGTCRNVPWLAFRMFASALFLVLV